MDGPVTNWKKILIALGIVLVLAGIFYAFVHNRQSVSSNSHACVNQTFSVGNSGQCISDGQHLLNWYLYGINEPNYMEITGQFSTTTESAVKKAQSGASLNVSGKLDPETWKLICEGKATPDWWNTAAKNAGCY